MPSARRLGVPVLVAALLLAGCTGVDTPGTSRTSVATSDGVTTDSTTDGITAVSTTDGGTTVSTTDEVTAVSTVDGATTVSTTAGTETDTPVTPSCRVEQPEYAVTPPEEPPTLNESTVERVAVQYEKSYQRARHDATYDLSFYQSRLRRAEIEPTDGGFEVTVELRVDFETRNGTEASGGYPHTYEVSEDGVVRDGTTVACW